MSSTHFESSIDRFNDRLEFEKIFGVKSATRAKIFTLFVIGLIFVGLGMCTQHYGLSTHLFIYLSQHSLQFQQGVSFVHFTAIDCLWINVAIGSAGALIASGSCLYLKYRMSRAARDIDFALYNNNEIGSSDT